MATSQATPPLLLGCAVAAVVGAVAADLALGGHPTHSVVLGAVALVVAALSRRLTSGVVAAVPAVAAALAVQPALHVAAGAARPTDHQTLLTHLLLDGTTAGVQIAVPALALVAVALGAPLVWLVVAAVVRRSRALVVSGPVPVRTVLLPLRPVPPGSLLRRCGWAVLAARRGPPTATAHARP